MIKSGEELLRLQAENQRLKKVIEEKEVTQEDIERYCKSRNLTIITNELFYKLTHKDEQITYIDCQKCENYKNPDYSKCMSCKKVKKHEK